MHYPCIVECFIRFQKPLYISSFFSLALSLITNTHSWLAAVIIPYSLCHCIRLTGTKTGLLCCSCLIQQGHFFIAQTIKKTLYHSLLRCQRRNENSCFLSVFITFTLFLSLLCCMAKRTITSVVTDRATVH